MAVSVGRIDDIFMLERYLLKKRPGPHPRLNGYRDVAFFHYDPATLAGFKTVKIFPSEEEAWYFFSDASTDDGHVAGPGQWKLERAINFRNAFDVVGTKSTYNYYRGLEEKKKTEWCMSEYRDFEHQPHKSVLIKMYRDSATSSSRQGNVADDQNMDDADSASSSDLRQKNVGNAMDPKGVFPVCEFIMAEDDEGTSDMSQDVGHEMDRSGIFLLCKTNRAEDHAWTSDLAQDLQDAMDRTGMFAERELAMAEDDKGTSDMSQDKGNVMGVTMVENDKGTSEDEGNAIEVAMAKDDKGTSDKSQDEGNAREVAMATDDKGTSDMSPDEVEMLLKKTKSAEINDL